MISEALHKAPELRCNAFAVLELDPSAGRAEVERAARNCIDALRLGLPGADSYPTPTGPAPRDLQRIREARHQLRDAATRAEQELWWLVLTRLSRRA